MAGFTYFPQCFAGSELPAFPKRMPEKLSLEPMLLWTFAAGSVAELALDLLLS